MALKEYEKKRDFARTPEPRGDAPAGKAAPDSGGKFVIQKHDASRLHYDLRLEMDGVLKSWAVPKGPSRNPADRQLAVHTEDHPLDYDDFEGVIPKGQYGGGTMIVWDRGTYVPVGDMGRNYKKGRLKFELHGEKLRGRWALVRMSGKAGDDGKNWLLIKDKDDHADRDGPPVVEAEPRSVKTGRTVDEVARGVTPAPAAERDWPRKAKQAPLPASVKPQLATLVDAAPTGDPWVHEIKFDGYRLLIRIDHGAKSPVQLWTRNGKDWTDRFRAIAQAAAALPVEQAWIDGELVVLERDGTSSFSALQQAITADDQDAMRFYAFDLLYLDGHDLRKATLLERKALLRPLLGGDAGNVIRYSDHVAGQGQAFHRQACDHELEGIISKKADAPYTGTRSKTWVKTKCSKRQELVIVGFTDPSGSRTGFGAILLAYQDAGGQWTYAGKVGTGFNDKTLADLHQRMTAIERDTPVDLQDPPTGKDYRTAHWVEPALLAEIQFTGWTDDHRVRHGVFQGLREDKPVNAVHREEPQPVKATAPTSSAKGDAPSQVLGVRLTHPGRVLFPDQGVTKGDLAAYYETVSDWMLPHVADRPLAVVRCPQGRQKHCFFQKNVSEGLPGPIGSIDVEINNGPAQHLKITGADGLIALTQIGVLEIHPWNSRADRVDRPDRIIFDLDPGEGVRWDAMNDAARELRELLLEVDLQSFIKLSGSKGHHVVVPLERRRDFDQAKAFAKAVCDTLGRRDPKRYVTVMTKAKRKGRIYLDYLRNGYGATAVAAYSTRRRSGAPVSTPIRWDELSDDLRADYYTIANLPQRLAQLKEDPWAGYFDVRQSITKAAEQYFGL